VQAGPSSILRTLPFLCGLWLPVIATTTVVSAQSPGFAAAIESRLGTPDASGELRVQGDEIAAVAVISDFYARRGFAPAWSEPRNVTDLLRAIRDSADDGLDPADYHFSRLERLRTTKALPDTPDFERADFERADFEILLTDALVRLGYHLWFGKVDAEQLDPSWNMNRTIPDLDPPAEIERALASGDLYQAIEKFKPSYPLYLGLKRELARLNRAALAGGWPSLTAGGKLEVGVQDDRVKALREQLRATGDLASAPELEPAAAEPPFDAALADAVRAFQQRMGLATDGKVGPGTLAELNVPVEDRIRQLRINLDRGRVLLHDLPPEFVVVNIAGFEVFFVRGKEIVWQSRAQVGKPYRATPQFRSEITYLVFNPTWTVPPGIVKNDILPAARRDPSSISRRGLKVIDSAGRVISPSSVDWSRFKSGHIPYTLRQDPGPTNALGRVKFMFPNQYSVYLHDTPSRALFDADTRATSAGCVRIERPFELAELLLQDPERWNAAAIARTVARGQLQNVTLKPRVPVLLAYWTAWVDANDRVNFRRDIYGRDAAWGKALDARFAFRKRPLS